MVDEPEREEARVVMELVVHDGEFRVFGVGDSALTRTRVDMLNLANSVHGGCTAYLVDLCVCFSFSES